MLRHDGDPSVRSLIVNLLNPLGADAGLVASAYTMLEAAGHSEVERQPGETAKSLFDPGNSKRRSLILALGTYGPAALSAPEEQALTDRLLNVYRTDPDSGIHGAVEWTLRRWKKEARLVAVDLELQGRPDPGDRRWYVSPGGQTFSVIDGPVEFSMGSPSSDPERDSSLETPRRAAIPRRYAIATKEVTVAQFQRFLETHREYGMERSTMSRYSPDPDDPWIGATWYGAAAYCNWLSEQEGLPKEQWCYLPSKAGSYLPGMIIPADALDRTGYRLPTEIEWEYAGRAGSRTSRCYGLLTELLGQYGWYQANSGGQAQSCGSLMPNDLGLFDMLGNVFEWSQDRNQTYRPRRHGVVIDRPGIDETISDVQLRMLRGGGFDVSADFLRSAVRAGESPRYASYDSGFRVARTLFTIRQP